MIISDDTTLILKSRRDHCRETCTRLDLILVKLETFLRDNKLKLNIDKTQLLRITPRQQFVANRGEKVVLDVVDTRWKQYYT